MSVTIELTPEEEARLRAVAHSRGLQIEELAHRLIASQLPPALSGNPTLDLLEDWNRQDATDDPDEIAARRGEWREFQEDAASPGLSLRTPKP